MQRILIKPLQLDPYVHPDAMNDMKSHHNHVASKRANQQYCYL